MLAVYCWISFVVACLLLGLIGMLIEEFEEWWKSID